MNHFKKIVVIVIATFLPRVNSTFGSNNFHGLKHRNLIDIKELENSVIKNSKKRNKEFIEKRLAQTKYETLRKEKEEKEEKFKETLLFVKNEITRLSRCKNENKKSEIGTFDSEIEKLKKEKERIENIINPIQAEMNRIYKPIKEEADEFLPTGGFKSMLEKKIKRNKEIKERNKELKAYLEKIKKEAKKRKELKKLEEEKQEEKRLEEEKQEEKRRKKERNSSRRKRREERELRKKRKITNRSNLTESLFEESEKKILERKGEKTTATNLVVGGISCLCVVPFTDIVTGTMGTVGIIAAGSLLIGGGIYTSYEANAIVIPENYLDKIYTKVNFTYPSSDDESISADEFISEDDSDDEDEDDLLLGSNNFLIERSNNSNSLKIHNK